MRLRTGFGLVIGHNGFRRDELPVVVELETARAEVVHTGDDDELSLFVEVPVNAATLSPAPEGGVEVAETGVAHAVAREVTDAVAFLSRCPLTLVGRGQPELLADDAADEEVLNEVGTRVVQRGMARGSAVMTLRLVGSNVALLCARADGIRLYSDALKMGTSASQLRELWRVVEAAFGAQAGRLVALVAESSIATDLGLSAADLSRILVLRGRASHASSRPRANLAELAAVEGEAVEIVDHVKALAEALIIRKADWGTADTNVDENAPRYPYVLNEEGVPTFFLALGKREP